jgi:hypothetical protein
MGVAKRLMEHHEHQRGVAVSIAIQAGVLMVCEYHEDCVFDGGRDPEGAYKLGNAKFTAGELTEVFETRKEMTDSIKDAIEDNYGISKCPRCAKMLED